MVSKAQFSQLCLEISEAEIHALVEAKV